MNRSAAGCLVAPLLLLVQAVACGEDGDRTAGDDVDLERQLCEALIALDERCGRQPDTLDRCMHHDDSRCFFDMIRPEVLQGAAACLGELPCADEPLLCIYEVGETSPTAGQQDYLTGCEAKEQTCEPEWTFGDYCELPYASTVTYEHMTVCLQLECDQVFPCLQGARPASCGT